MEQKSFQNSLKIFLIIIATGIWAIVLQNTGVISTNQRVYIEGGRVGIDNTVRVTGTVDVDNTVDINISEINGNRNVFFNNPRRGDKNKYYLLPVTVE